MLLYGYILFIHLSIDEHMGCFHSLVIMSDAAMNIYLQAFVWIYVFTCLGYIPWSRIAGSCYHSMFNPLGNSQTVF